MAPDPKRQADDDLREQIAALQAQVQALVSQASAGLNPSTLEDILTRTATASAIAAQQAQKRENETHHGMSHYNPEGDLVRPRVLKCGMSENGYDLDIDTLSITEVDLLNRAEPGVYGCTRTDGTRMEMTVHGEFGPSGNLSKLKFEFPTKDNRETLPSMVSRLREAFKVKTPEQIELESLRATVAALHTQSLTAA